MFVMSILLFGISMIVWTVKQATSVKVQESNNYMLKYQMADMNINKIMKLEEEFKAKYSIELQNTTFINLEEELQNSNAKRAQQKPIKLTLGDNSFSYAITTKRGEVVKDAEVSFLLTRPHTRVDDQLEKKLKFDGKYYLTQALKLSKKGRYTLAIKVKIADVTGYLETPAYLK